MASTAHVIMVHAISGVMLTVLCAIIQMTHDGQCDMLQYTVSGKRLYPMSRD